MILLFSGRMAQLLSRQRDRLGRILGRFPRCPHRPARGKTLFTREEPLQHIGLSATIVGLYEDILKFASQEKTGYQEMISSIVLHILGTVYYKKKKQLLHEYLRCG